MIVRKNGKKLKKTEKTNKKFLQYKQKQVIVYPI